MCAVVCMCFGRQPVMGPAYSQRVNIVTTTATSVINFDPYAFHEQYHEFMNTGSATDPTDLRRKVGAPQAAARPLVVKDRKKRGRGDASDLSYLGPWAGYEDEEETRKTCLEKGTLTAEQLRERKELGLDGEGKAKEGAAAGACHPSPTPLHTRTRTHASYGMCTRAAVVWRCGVPRSPTGTCALR